MQVSNFTWKTFSTVNCISSFPSTYGWDHVVQGLVQMGFILMDSYGPKGAFGRVDLVPGIQSGPTHQACQLGAKMLLNTFKVRLLKNIRCLELVLPRKSRPDRTEK